MSVEIIFRKNIEPLIQKEIEHFLLPFVWLIPTWCHRLFIDIEDASGAAVRTSVTFEYRFANISFSPAWLTCDDEEKQIHVIHELLHTSNCAYVNFTEEAIDNLLPQDENKKLHGYLMEQSRIHLEGMTQDLARAIYQRFK